MVRRCLHVAAAAPRFMALARPAFPPPPAPRQARNIEAAIANSWAIWLNGRPLPASYATASRLNSSVNCRRAALSRQLGCGFAANGWARRRGPGEIVCLGPLRHILKRGKFQIDLLPRQESPCQKV
jgi:hypothetical protein